jgi:transcriptional regulator with XRE-family HTH domain
MPKATGLVDVLKREIKKRGITYVELARRINVSPASVKRIFAQKNFTLQRLDEILEATEISLHDLAQRSYEESLIDQLSYELEKELISDPKKFVVAVSAMNYISAEKITEIYNISEVEVTNYLLRLDKLGILVLYPNNRYKLLLSRTFNWIPNGPIQNFHRAESFDDYLDASFNETNEIMQFLSVMLSKQARSTFINRMKKLAQDISEQHQDDSELPFEERHRMSFMISARPWIPVRFKALVRPEYIEKFMANKASANLAQSNQKSKK